MLMNVKKTKQSSFSGDSLEDILQGILLYSKLKPTERKRKALCANILEIARDSYYMAKEKEV